MSSPFARRDVLRGLGALAVGGLAAGCSTSTSPMSMPTGPLPPSTPLAPTAGQRVVSATLRPHSTTVDLGGPTVSTWAYGDGIPGPLLRATAGDLVRVRVENGLPDPTTVHFHGIALRNVADGVPGLTQEPVASGAAYLHEFVVPDPGTYFYHPHVGVQIDRGLYGVLLVDDPADPGDEDLEWVVVLDDWLDGLGRTPDQVLADLVSAGGGPGDGKVGMGMGGMGGMDHGGMGGMGGRYGGAGDVDYPHFLVNGRVAAAPLTQAARPGQRVRLRIVNAAADTVFAVALGGHRMTVTHSDGFPVQPTECSALYVGMGERYDVTVTAGDGVFPLVASAVGKEGQAVGLLRTASGAAPAPTVTLPELSGDVLAGSSLVPAEGSRLSRRTADRSLDVALQGSMEPYEWGINGAVYGKNEPLVVSQGERVRLLVENRSMMTHPVHVHGHTFALADSGLRKDTVLLAPMEGVVLELDADNPGAWMAHCHNAYHGEAGMMVALRYA